MFAIALVLVIPVHATRPAIVTGTSVITQFTVTGTQTLADGSVIVHYTLQATLRGGMQGTVAGTGTFILNSLGQGTNTVIGLFTGTTNGSQPGTAVVRVVGTVDTVAMTTNGHLTIGHGTEGLAGVHGQGTSSTFNGSGPYLFRIHFAPG